MLAKMLVGWVSLVVQWKPWMGDLDFPLHLRAALQSDGQESRMPGVHQLINASLGGPGALSVQGQIVPSSVMQAASKVFLPLPWSRLPSFPWITVARPATSFIRLSAAQVWLGNSSGRWHFFEEKQEQGGEPTSLSWRGCSVHYFSPLWRQSKEKHEVYWKEFEASTS